jgi:hypothetical protein
LMMKIPFGSGKIEVKSGPKTVCKSIKSSHDLVKQKNGAHSTSPIVHVYRQKARTAGSLPPLLFIYAIVAASPRISQRWTNRRTTDRCWQDHRR